MIELLKTFWHRFIRKPAPTPVAVAAPVVAPAPITPVAPATPVVVPTPSPDVVQVQQALANMIATGSVNPSAPVPAPVPVAPSIIQVPTFVADFSKGDLSAFTVSNWSAPGSNATHKGVFTPANVFFVNGLLCLKLSQAKNADGTFTSTGGEIATNQKFLYGTYEWVAKTSSNAAASTSAGAAISGSISGCFAYNTNAVTEIDVEIEGIASRCNLVQFTSWVGDTNPNEATKVAATPPNAGFHSYKFVWRPTGITFYIDDQPASAHSKVIGNTAAAAMINHWGTNDVNWGGLATPDVDRYMWVKSFSYTPL